MIKLYYYISPKYKSCKLDINNKRCSYADSMHKL